MSGRFPAASSIDAMWAASISGQCLLRLISDNDANTEGSEHDMLGDIRYVPVKGIVENSDFFDASAFEYSVGEASMIDPQQRLFLEICAEGLDRAAIDPSRYSGRVGVYGGQFMSTYFLRNLLGHDELARDPIRRIAAFQGNTVDQLATRVAHRLGLTGPALTIQTACSTSLVAVHIACQALLTGECDAALAGGVALSFPSHVGYQTAEGTILSISGRCKPFDASADGTIFSDGAGVVVLKRLEDAISDGDPVHAIILGTAINNDGAQKVGYTAPSLDGQVSVLSEALAHANISPNQVGYIETHGAGTAIGDRIEIAAIAAAYGVSERNNPLAIGALKANIGHCEAAAGVAGLIRAICAVKEGRIPPIAGLSEVLPQLDSSQNFHFPTQASGWPVLGERIAGVSAFGIGGTNAHIVIAAPPPALVEAKEISAARRLYPLSAHSQDSLLLFSKSLAGALNLKLDEKNIQATLALGRPASSWRASIVCKDVSSLKESLASIRPIRANKESTVYLVFSDSHSIRKGAVRSLIKELSGFGPLLADVCKYFDASDGNNLYQILLDGDDITLADPTIAFPGAAAIGVAGSEWLKNLRIEWDGVIGTGMGELIAACVAGSIDKNTLASLIVKYGELRTQLDIEGIPITQEQEDQWDKSVASCISHCCKAFFCASAGHWEQNGLPPLPNCKSLIRSSSYDLAGIINSAFSTIRHAEAAIALNVSIGDEPQLKRSFSSLRQDNLLTLFSSNEAKNEYSGFKTIGELWNRGIDLSWEEIVEADATKCDLPPRAFSRIRCFLDKKVEPSQVLATQELVTQAGRLLAPVFQSLPEFLDGGMQQGRRRWLIVCSSLDNTDSLRDYLESKGQVVTIAVHGEQYQRLKRGVYTVPGQSPQAWTELMRDLRALVRTPEAVVDMRALKSQTHDLLAGSSALLAGLLAESTGNKISLLCLARSAVSIVGTESIDPSSAALMAWAKVAAQEADAGLKVSGVDIDITLDDANLPQHVLPLIARLPFEFEGRVPLSLRGERLFIRRFQPLSEMRASNHRFKANDVYLIIGGLGEIGQILATHLKGNVGATVLTASRQTNEGRNGHFQLDTSEPASVRQAIAEIVAHYGRLDGVFLAAGLAEAATARESTLEIYNRMLIPKANSVAALSQVLADLKVSPQFVVGLASSSMVFGGPTQAAYAAANAAMEAQMAIANKDGETRWFTLVLDTVSKTGMARTGQTEIGSKLAKYRESVALSPTEIPGLVESTIGQRLTTVLATRLTAESIDHIDDVFHKAWHAGRFAQSRPDIATPYVAPRDEVEIAIVEVFERVLGFSGVGIEDDFIDLGGHSLLAAQLRSDINRTFGVELRISEVFEHTTPARLALLLEEIINAESLETVKEVR